MDMVGKTKGCTRLKNPYLSDDYVEMLMDYAEGNELLTGIVEAIVKKYDPYGEGPLYCRTVIDWDKVKSLKATGRTFPELLAHFLREKKMTAPEAYNKIGMSRQWFSKISRMRNWSRPGKGAVLGLALAMRLTLSEARQLVWSADYAFMDSDVRDIAVQYLLEHEFYDMPQILMNFHECGFEPFIPQPEDRIRKK